MTVISKQALLEQGEKLCTIATASIIPYVKGGMSLSGMDCQGLVEYCLIQAGVPKSECNLGGSNAHWRACMWRGTPEECVARFGEVPDGAVVFIVSGDGGEAARGYKDDLGNAEHMGLVLRGRALHASASRNKVAESVFNDKTIPNGGWNAVGLLPWVDYGYSMPDEHKPSIPAIVTATTATVTASHGSTVKMRQKPSKRCNLYWDVPVGAAIEIRGPETKGWYPVRYGGRNGYMATEFVRITQEPTSSMPDKDPSTSKSANYAAEIYDLTYEQAEAIRAQYPHARTYEICG